LQKFLSPEDVAKRLGISNKTVYKWLNEKRLRGAKMGHLWRIDSSDLDRFIEEAYKRGGGDNNDGS